MPMTQTIIARVNRRLNAEHAVDLRQRRAWFDDEHTDPPTPLAGQAPQQDVDEFDFEQLSPAVQRYIKGLRAEAADYRTRAKREQEQAREREQQRLAEQGNWKAIAEQKAEEAARLKAYEERATQLEAMIRASNDGRIQQIPETMRKVVPVEYPPEKLAAWLDSNLSLLTRPPAPNLDAGIGSGANGKSVQLTAEQKAAARLAGMTEAQFEAALEKAQQRSQGI
jgi:phage I-like protein